LEQRNLCAEPERECNPIWDLIQFPVRRRSSAADCQCDSRLLQDRLAYDGWDPGTCRGRHTNPDAYSNSNCDRDSYGHGNRDIYTYCYSYSDRHGNGNGHCHCYTDAYFHTETNPDAKRYGFAKATSNAAAAPVGPGDERALGWNALSSTRWQK
jgi:hypothetical protein